MLHPAWRITSIAVGMVALAASLASARPLFLSDFHGFSVGGSLIDVVLQDLNHDDRLDLVAAVQDANAVLARLGDGEGDFGPATNLPLPAWPSALAAGDLDGDPHPDIAVTHGFSTLSIFHGNGDGTFAPRADFGVGGTPAGLAVGDLNEDGKPDVAVTSQASHTVSILFGFMPNFWYPVVEVGTGLNPRTVALHDLNGDQHLDLVVVCPGTGTVTVHLGDGTGGLAPWTTYPATTSAYGLAIDDATGDGVVDLVFSSTGPGLVSVLPGNGDGSFAAGSDFAAGTTPRGIAIAALDGDPPLDIAVANTAPNSFSVLRGLGGGALAAPASKAATTAPAACAAGDLNADGDVDVVVGGSSGISIHLGNGDGSFGMETNTYAFTPDLKTATAVDLDVDGAVDLAVTSFDALSILWGRGDGTFESGPAFSFPIQTHPRWVAAGDLDVDGWLDLVAANHGANTLAIFRGTGNRTFAPAGTLAVPGGPFAVEIVPLDGDQHLDLIVLDHNWINSFLGNGDGTFAPYTSYYATNYYSSDLEVADVNLDGALDAVVAQGGCCPGGFWLLLGNGDGSFQPRQAIWIQEEVHGQAVGVGLLDGDPFPDVAMVNDVSGAVDLVYAACGNGDGTFAAPVQAGRSFSPHFLEVADMDGDGAADLVVANRTAPGTPSLHLGNGDGTFGTRLDFGIAGSTCFARAADLNGDGAMDLIAADQASPKVWVLLNQRGTPTDAGERDQESAASRTPFVSAAELASGMVRIEYASGTAREHAPVQLAVYDVRGRLVRMLHAPASGPGRHVQVWDRVGASGARVVRGVYIVRLQAGDAEAVRKLVLARP